VRVTDKARVDIRVGFEEDWLEQAFGREVRNEQAAWFFDRDCDWWDPEPAVAVAYLTR